MLIRIRGIRCRTIVGVNAWERKKRQAVRVHVEVETDGRKAGRTDRLEDTVDYKAVTKELIRVVEASRFFLLESLASKVLAFVLEDKRVLRASVEVEKPGALRDAETVSVRVSGGRRGK